MSATHSKQLPAKQAYSRLQRIVSPLMLIVLIAQFAPFGLLAPPRATTDCPHCEMSGHHAIGPGSKCVHPGMRMGPGDTDQSAEAYSCACDANHAVFSMLPAIGKTLLIASWGDSAPDGDDIARLDPVAPIDSGSRVALFRPPRLI